jgi:hypothetical protein
VCTTSCHHFLPALLFAISCGSSGVAGNPDADIQAGDESSSGDSTPAAPIDATAQDGAPADALEHEGTPADAVSNAAVDASGDAEPADSAASYALCDGPIDPSLKACTSATDCTIQAHEDDCCGGVTYVGIARSSVAAFMQCEGAWAAHFPTCTCQSDAKSTEDGRCLGASCPSSDAATPTPGASPQVHCVCSGEIGSCRTFFP